MKKVVITILSFMMVFNFIFCGKVSYGVTNLSNDEISKDMSVIKDKIVLNFNPNIWVNDEENGTLYAVSTNDSKLLIFDTVALKVVKVLNFDGKTSGLYNGKDSVYVTFYERNSVKVINKISKKVTNGFSLDNSINSLCEYNDTIIYSSYDYSIRKYNLETNNEEVILNASLSYMSFEINREKNILYINGGMQSGYKTLYFDLVNNNIISETKFGYGYPIEDTKGVTHSDGDKLYNKNRVFNWNDGGHATGYFDEDLIYVNNGLAFSDKYVYDATSCLKLGELQLNDSLSISNVQTSNNTVFIYDNYALYYYRNTKGDINKDNVIDVLGGTWVNYMKGNEKAEVFENNYYILDMPYKINEWKLFEDYNTVLGISENNKAVMFFDSKTLDIKKIIYLPGIPSDITSNENYVYVAQDKINDIAVIDLEKMDVVNNIQVQGNPARIEYFNNKIYYTCNITLGVFEYDCTTKKERNLEIYHNLSDIEINPNKKILYVACSKDPVSNITYYSLEEDKVISRSFDKPGYGFENPDRRIIYNDGSVYYANRRFDDEDATNIQFDYGQDNTIFHVDSRYIYTKNKMYAKASNKYLGDFKPPLNLTTTSSIDDYYFYNKDNNYIMKFTDQEVYQKEDINKDSVIDVEDISLVSMHYNNKLNDSEYNVKYDINNDTIVDIFDLTSISKKIVD